MWYPDSLQMIPIVFGINVMHINEYAGHKVKIVKCLYFYNQAGFAGFFRCGKNRGKTAVFSTWKKQVSSSFFH